MRIKSSTAYIALLVSAICYVAADSVGDVHSSKNIVFGCFWGGSSHTNFVLGILDELAQRGHNVTYATKGEEHMGFGKPFKHVRTAAIKGDAVNVHDFLKEIPHSDIFDIGIASITKLTLNYPGEFSAFQEFFREGNYDVVLCDHVSMACIDAAKSLKMPVIITMFKAISPDTEAPYINVDTMYTMVEPTSLTMSFSSRFYRHFIQPFRLLFVLYGPITRHIDVQRQVGAQPLNPPEDPWKDFLKIVNGAYGLDAARPLGPLVELVGPIVTPYYSPITPDLKEYLDSHKRVAYIAFGQHITPDQYDINLVLSVLIDNFNKGTIDGFVWATFRASDAIPDTVTLPSGTVYDMNAIKTGRDPHCRLIYWAPQQALLQHPSISVFVTHGGISSIHEALLNGVRLVAYPFTGDQPMNARLLVQENLGRLFDYRMSPVEASKVLETVALDTTGEISRNVKKFQAFVRVRSRTGPIKGADLVEEVAFMHKDGLLPHRYEASRQMSFVKSTNMDIYAALIVSIVAMMSCFWYAVSYFCCTRSPTKYKTL